MQEVDSEFEVFGVPVPISLAFEDLDLVVDAFDLSSGDAMFEVIEKSIHMPGQFIGETDEQVDPAGPSCRKPVADKRSRFLLTSTHPEPSQLLLEDVGGADLLVDGQQFIEPFSGVPILQN